MFTNFKLSRVFHLVMEYVGLSKLLRNVTTKWRPKHSAIEDKNDLSFEVSLSKQYFFHNES